MATSEGFLNYILEQLDGIPDITFRPMMGEYLLYYRGKLVGGVYDNRVLVKPVEAAKKLMPNAEMRLPYEGAKDMLLLEDFENTQFVKELFEATYPELPEPRIKR